MTVSETFVVKRDGSHETADISKIREVIEFCVSGLNVDAAKLELFISTLDPGTATRKIQEALILGAVSLATAQDPAWLNVAGRLNLWGLRKEAAVARGLPIEQIYDNFAGWCQGMVYAGTVADPKNPRYYHPRLTADYSYAELVVAGSWIHADRDWVYDYAGSVMWAERYLLEYELPQQCFLAIALFLAIDEAPNVRMQIAREFYDAFSQREISLATPLLLNARTKRPYLASCFIIQMGDSLAEISETAANVGAISAANGGVGVNMSHIRAKGSWVGGRAGASNGITPWMRIINDYTVAVDQGGVRAGSATPSIDIWHLDVYDLLDSQTQHGDARTKAFDLFPQLVVPDLFMIRARADDFWTLLDPHEVKEKYGIQLNELYGAEFERIYTAIESDIQSCAPGHCTLYRVVKAKDLMKSVMKADFDTGMPFWAFKDTINLRNPNRHSGYIPGVNICVESFSNVKFNEEAHTCNLVSLNLANLLDEEHRNHCARLAVRILDNSIELSLAPIPASRTHNVKYRTIGVGMMGAADYFAHQGWGYDRHVKEIGNLFEDISLEIYSASADLAIERGAYPDFEGSQWSQGRPIGLSIEQVMANSHSPNRWLELNARIMATGIRNSQCIAIAPNGSSGLIQGSTPSILPAFKRKYQQKNGEGFLPIIPPFMADRFWFYQENIHLDQKHIVACTAEIQKWVDTGISMELVLNTNTITPADYYNLIFQAWESGCKTMYYIRTVDPKVTQAGVAACDACT